MTTQGEVLQWRGRDAIDRDGAGVGTVEQVYLDNETGRPEWLAVRMGTPGRRATVVPVSGASLEGDAVRLPYERTQIVQAPGIEAGAELGPDDETNLSRHYGLDYGAGLSSGVSGGEALGGGTTGSGRADRGGDEAAR